MRPRLLFILAALPLLTACDQLTELLGLPNPSRIEAEGQAIGSACRQSGRSIEDCYMLNPNAQKAAVFAGWKAMNDYMMEHKLREVPSQLQLPAPLPAPEPRPAPVTPEHNV
ncbi:MAG: hypothetical protein LBB76_04900 [Azoarcus sp.]|jgi:hypothetical protein|nr:hypothetical protein [Azoarcus sp.]